MLRSDCSNATWLAATITKACIYDHDLFECCKLLKSLNIASLNAV